MIVACVPTVARDDGIRGERLVQGSFSENLEVGSVGDRQRGRERERLILPEAAWHWGCGASVEIR